MQDFNPHGVVAVKQISETEVEVRYGSGLKPVILSNTTASQVLAQIEKAKFKDR